MKRVACLVLALAAGVAAGCGQPAEHSSAAPEEAVVTDDPKPPAAEGKGVPPVIAELIKERGKLHKRQTGALLTITARWVHDPGLEPAVRIDWLIDYDGPRRPFTILAPDKAMGANPAVAHFWHLKPDGTAAVFTWGLGGGGPAGKLPHKQKGMYSVSDGGKPVTGQFNAGGSHLKGKMGREPRPGDPPMWVQMEYAPTDRGDGFDWPVDPATGFATKGPAWTFDAWTGHLWSPVVPVAVK
jgi:hypothetical protein